MICTLNGGKGASIKGQEHGQRSRRKPRREELHNHCRFAVFSFMGYSKKQNNLISLVCKCVGILHVDRY